MLAMIFNGNFRCGAGNIHPLWALSAARKNFFAKMIKILLNKFLVSDCLDNNQAPTAVQLRGGSTSRLSGMTWKIFIQHFFKKI
jgi:hypothetical protein